MRDDHIAEDMQSYFYPNGMSKYDKFFEYVLPWLILLAIVVGLYFTAMYGLEFLIELSKPVSDGMKAVGL